MSPPDRAQSAPAFHKRKLLEPGESFKASINMPPKWSIRAKTSFGNAVQPSETEPSGPLADKVDQILTRQPSWTMLARGSGIPPAPNQPGPGQYPIPSTIYGSHPALPVAGRVPKRTEERKSMAAPNAASTPSPQQYDTLLSKGKNHTFGRADQAAAPKFTMRAKTSFGNAVKPSDTEPSGPLADKVDQILTRQPCWSMLGRSSGIPPAPNQPGPGQYPIPSTIYGSHPALPVAGRVPKRTEERKSMANPNDTPSPQQYDTLQSKGKNHTFGRADQHAAPKFTMRAKTSFGNQVKPSETEPSGPLADKVDNILDRPPSWTMLGRSSGIPPAPNQPGPGQYPIPSTIYGSHPAISVAGRVPKRTEERQSMAAPNAASTPSPQDYDTLLSKGKNHTFGRADQAAAPKFTMRAKTSFGDQVKKSETEPSGPLSDKVDNILSRPPSWTMLGRSAGIPPAPNQPGPGQYPIPGSIYGAHPALTTPGRVPKTTEKRWKEPVMDERPY